MSSLSSNTYDQISQSEIDSLDEFLSPLLVDFPDIYSMPISTSEFSSSSDFIPVPSSASSSTRALVPVFPSPHPPSHAQAHANPQAMPIPTLACRWVSRYDLPLTCGVHLPADPKHACAHFRLAHNVRGNDKAIVSCQWQGCHAPPMQRGSVIRHLLAVHLGLLRWQCNVCGRMFSRKGTGHLCDGGSGAEE